jgi:phosphohistidine phosphatase
MELFLVQHGEAKAEDEDPERPLTASGALTVNNIAAWAARAGITVDEIRHSGKRRAEETAAIIAGHLQPPRGPVAAVGLKPKDDVRPAANEVGKSEGSLMLVGHLPFLSRMASLLLVGDPERSLIRFRNSGIVCLEREQSNWFLSWIVIPDIL